MRRSLLNKRILPKPLRQALVLITLLLLPSAAWGEEEIKTTFTGYNNSSITFNDNSYMWEIVENQNATFETYEYNNEEYSLKISPSTEGAFSVMLKSKFTVSGTISQGNQLCTLAMGSVNPDANSSGNFKFLYGPSISEISYLSNVNFPLGNIELSATNVSSTLEISKSFVYIQISGFTEGIYLKSITLSNKLTESFDIKVAGIVPEENGDITGASSTGTVTYDATTRTLTLNNATIDGDIIKSSSADDKTLIIKLEESNSLTGSIAFNSQLGDLTFTGDGSLAISSEEGVLSGIKEFNASGFYLATDHPLPFINEYGYYLCAVPDASGTDWSVKQLTVSKDLEVYPIWVHNETGTGYTQVTKDNKDNVLSNNHIAYNNETPTLTLSDYTLTTTGGSQSLYAFYIGKDLKNMTVNLVGNSTIGDNDNGGSGFAFEELSEQEEKASLTFTTSSTPSGSLTVGSELTDGSVTVNYSNGLGYTISTKKVSTDWTRLIIGETPITGNATTVEGYSNVSFDDETSTLTLGLYDATNTLTLGGVTIGTQNSTVTDINVYIKDLTVEISGNNTVYGRFFGFYEENGSRAGTITFKKKSDAETANLTISGLGDDHGPVTHFASSTVEEGLYLSGTDTDNDPVSSLSYHDGEYYDFNNSNNNVKEVLITSNEPGTKLWIGETLVTSSNTNVFAGDDDLDGKVSYDATNHTLSLNGATIEDEIISNVGTLTIDLTGSNSINSISATGNATALAFTGDGTLTLENSDGVITGFSSVNTGGFNLLSNSTPGIHWNATSNKFMDFANFDIAKELTLTKATVYQLWVGGVQVTGENEDGITGVTYTVGQESFQSIFGTVSFNPDGNILTLTDASIGSPFSYCEAPIISNLPNLEININKIDRGCHLEGYQNGFIDDGSGCAKSLNTDATLVFSTNYTSSSEAESPTMQIDCYDPIASGFKSISTNNQIIYKRTSNYYWVQRIAQPTMSLVNGSLQLSDNNEIDLNYEANSAVTLKYKITDATGTAGEEKTYVATTAETINNPCTIDAWAVYQSQESELVTGKYFGIADKTIVFSSTTSGSELKASDFELSPATEGVSIAIINAYNSNVISYNAETGATIVGIGACNIDIKINANEGSNIQILNTPTINPDTPGAQTAYIITKEVTVLPDKPSIVKDAEHDYIETDKITITRTSVEGEVAENIKIFYIWSDDEVEVKTYQPYVDGGSVSIYSEPIAAQTGTLRAWVGYHAGDNYYYNSEVVSEEFTVYEIAEMEWESETQTYGTFYNPDKDMAVPTGSTAYIVTGISEDGTSVTISPVSYIKAGVAVLIERNKTTEVSKTTDFSASKMNYSNPNTPAQPSATDNWYVIYNNKFVKVTEGTQVKGGKCYLNLNSTPAGTRGFYNIGDGEGTTAIREVRSEGVKGEKLADGEWHDLQGRKFTTKPTKPGLYILNGKKIVIK